MIKKRIKYIDYNGKEVEEDLYFDMTSLVFTKFSAKYADFSAVDTKSESSTQDAIVAFINKVVDTNDLGKMIEFLEDFILTAYGERGSDGKHFYKTKEIRNEFENSKAFAEIFEELMSNENSIEPFIYGVLGVNPEALANKNVKVIE